METGNKSALYSKKVPSFFFASNMRFVLTSENALERQLNVARVQGGSLNEGQAVLS